MDVYEKAREFAEEFILPLAKRCDDEGIFPEEAFREMGKQGYLKLIVPEEYGGYGKGLVEHSEVCRAFSKSCSTAGLCYMMHNVALIAILTNGSEELKEKICRDIVENNKFLALAYSEFGTGTHFYKPEIETEFVGDKVIFNGVKSMVTSANFASYYLVIAPSENKDEIDNWIFPLETEGLSFEEGKWHGMGMRGNVSCPMVLKNAVLTKDMRIGNPGSGINQVFNSVAIYFIEGLASVYTGLCENVLAEAVKHSKERKYPNDGGLYKIERIQVHLAKIFTMTNACIYATKEGARAGAENEPDALEKILSARILASESAIETARLGMRVGGGKAYNRQGCMERLVRDAYAGQIMAPSVDVLVTWLGKTVTGQPIL